MYRLLKIVAFVVFLLSLNACANGQSFKNRLAEGQAQDWSTTALHYAASTHSLQTFKNRLAEGQAQDWSTTALHYAASKHSL